MRVVLDTNVLVSGVSFAGQPARVLEARLADKFDLVVSAEILEEYRRTARRIGEKFPEIDLSPLLDLIAAHALFVVPARLRLRRNRDRDPTAIPRAALGAVNRAPPPPATCRVS